MKLSVKIMAHHKRADFVPHLVEQLGITEDDVIWDRHQDRWDTGRRAWEAIDPNAGWGCVIQDDALVAGDFIPGMEAALDYVPDRCLVSPYIGTRRPSSSRVERAVREAAAADASWVEMPSLNWGVAIIAPVRIIAGMLPWCDVQPYPNYDRRIGRYAIDVLRYPTWCTWPSLVDHRDTPSLIGHGGGRVAHRFIGEDASAADIDWSKGSVRLGAVRTSARTLPPSGVGSGSIYGTRGYRPARKLRVPRPGRFTNDEPPLRPEGSE